MGGRGWRPAGGVRPKAIKRVQVVLALVGILASLAAFSLSVISALGYSGLFLLMVGESMILPIPSEAVLPFAGFLASAGRFTLVAAWVVATLGTIVGSLLSYALGVFGVRPLLERYGKFVFVTPHHIDVAHAFFEKRSAALGVFLSRFVPVVRHLISIPAGSARMPLGPFIAATVLGGGAWNFILLYAGYQFGAHYEDVSAFVDHYKWVLLAAAVFLALAAWVAYRMRSKKRVARADAGGERSPGPPP